MEQLQAEVGSFKLAMLGAFYEKHDLHYRTLLDLGTLCLPLEAGSKLLHHRQLLTIGCQVEALLAQVLHGTDAFAMVAKGAQLRRIEQEFKALKVLYRAQFGDIIGSSYHWQKRDLDGRCVNPYFSPRQSTDNFFLAEDEAADSEPLYVGETLRVQIIATLKLESIKEDFAEAVEDAALNPLKQLQGLKDALDRELERVEQFNFEKIERTLQECRRMIAEAPVPLDQREEKVNQIQLLHDKAHEYKVKHADAWKAEED